MTPQVILRELGRINIGNILMETQQFPVVRFPRA
jgi:hypothetical protein